MKKYQVIMTGICSLVLVFGLTLTACKHDSDSGGGILDAVRGRGDGNSNSNIVPATPAGIVISAVSQSSITITWSSVSGASSYRVFRADNNSESYAFLGETGSASYTDKEVSQNIPYSYKVSAYNNAGPSSQSSSASAIITGSIGSGVSLPGMPTNVRATRRSSDQVYVTWDPVSGVTTYLIYWAEEAAGPYELDGTANTPSHTSVNWEGYDYGYFKVSAVNAAGEGPQSAVASFGTYSSGESHSAPSAPSGVYASASSPSSITVSWAEVPGASGYSIYRALDINDQFSYRGSATSTSYSDTGLTQGTTYYYKIVAYNQYGESVLSTAASATTSESIPSTPSSVYASASSTSSITVSWAEVPGVSSYKVYRSQAQIYYDLIGTVSSASYTDTGLSAGTTYYYKVSASNGAGDSPQSTTAASATTWSSSGSNGSTLSAPTGVSASKLSSDEVYVSWYPVSGAVEYVVYWASSETGTYSYDGTTKDTSFISEGWDGLSRAYFKISAVNSAGYESEQSRSASVYLGEGHYSIGTAAQNKLAIEKMR